MDVYFERIAGVAERSETPERLESADLPIPNEQDVEVLATDGLDENGFPLNPMKEQDMLWFVQAARLYRPLKSCAGTARVSGLILMMAGVFTATGGVLGIVFGGLPAGAFSLVLGLLLVTLGTLERSGAARVAAAEASGPRRLFWNQITLFALIALSCGTEWNEMQQAQASGAFSLVPAGEQVPPEVAEMVAQLETIVPALAYGVFGLVIGLSLIFQGGLALYYLSRRKAIVHFHEELPPWVSETVLVIARR